MLIFWQKDNGQLGVSSYRPLTDVCIILSPSTGTNLSIQSIVGQMHDHMLQFKLEDTLRRGLNTNGWCGPRTLIQRHLIDTIAFHCMVPVDQVLGLHVGDIAPVRNAEKKPTEIHITFSTHAANSSVGMHAM